MASDKHKNISNRNQFDLATSEPSSPTTASPGYPNTPINQDSDLNFHFMKMTEDFKKDINNSLKEIQENTSKQEEALQDETHKSLKEVQESTIKGEGIEWNRPGSKNGNRTIKENSKGGRPRDGKPRKENGSHRWKHHQQNTRDRKISEAEDTIEDIDTTVKGNTKTKKLLTQNIQEIQDTIKRPNLRIIGIEESKDSQLKEL
jgi:gas vesicle protein